MLGEIRKLFVSFGISAFLLKADWPAVGWILRIHIKGTKAIIEKEKKDLNYPIYGRTDVLFFLFLKWFALIYFILLGKEK